MTNAVLRAQETLICFRKIAPLQNQLVVICCHQIPLSFCFLKHLLNGSILRNQQKLSQRIVKDQETGTHHRSQSPSRSLTPSSLCKKREPACLKRKKVLLLPAPTDRIGYHNRPTGIHGYGLSGQFGQRRQRTPSTGTGGYCFLCPRSPAMSASTAP